MKKLRNIITYVSLAFLLSACSSPEADTAENIADDGISGIKPPEGCQIIENIEDFEPVTGDQSYNRETDFNTSFYILNGADAGGVLYLFSGSNWLCYFDKNSGSSGMVCGKPDCEHANENCNAFVHQTWGTQYYKGFLYTVVLANLELKKISTDGSQRESLGKLADISAADTLSWIIHRGYIYYCYTWNDGTTEDAYYLNNSNCIFRKALDKDSEPECIMALPVLSNMYECQFVATGSYVYIKVPKAGEMEGYLYRYNTESGKLEWFKEWGDIISGVFIRDNKIYYSENNKNENKTIVYQYDAEKKDKKTFIEIDGLADGIKYDKDFIYIPYEYEEEWRTGIWNWQGEYIAEIPSFKKISDEKKYRNWIGTDDRNIYINCQVITETKEENIYAPIMGNGYQIIEYIEKEDILDGEYEIKEWSEMAEE